MPGLDERELDVVDRQRFARAVVEVLERRERDFRAAAANRDAVAAARQRHVERLFDLPQIFVERAAEVREARVVVARRGEFQCLSGFQSGVGFLLRQCVAALASPCASTSSPRSEWGYA